MDEYWCDCCGEPLYIETETYWSDDSWYVDSTYVEPTYVEPAYVEPAYVEPAYVEQPVYYDTSYVEPVYLEPAYVEPVYVEPVYVEPAYVAPAYVEPAYTIEPVYVEPAYTIQPAYVEPAHVSTIGGYPSTSYTVVAPTTEVYSTPANLASVLANASVGGNPWATPELTQMSALSNFFQQQALTAGPAPTVAVNDPSMSSVYSTINGMTLANITAMQSRTISPIWAG